MRRPFVALIFILSALSMVSAAGDLETAAEQYASVFPTAAMEDATTLDLERVGERVVESRVVPGRRLRAVELRFASFEWQGEVWRHDAVLLLPEDGVPEQALGKGTVVAGIRSYADASAAVLGIPSLLITSGNPGPRYGEPSEGELMGFSLARQAATGDPRWNGYGWLGKVLVRGVTVLAALPETRVEEAVTTGCSKRGMAAWIAAAADRRVTGAFPVCWNTGSYRETAKQLVDRLGGDYQQGRTGTRAPAFVPAREQYERTLTPDFERLAALTDPVLFADLIAEDAILYAAGTNDPLYHVLASTLVVPKLRGEKRAILVANADHTPDTPQHVEAWTMWTAHVLLGRPVPTLDVTFDAGQETISVAARVESQTELISVELVSADDPSGRYHDARWSSRPMAPRDGLWQAALPRGHDGPTAFFVAVRDRDPARGTGYMTSPPYEVAPADDSD